MINRRQIGDLQNAAVFHEKVKEAPRRAAGQMVGELSIDSSLLGLISM